MGVNKNCYSKISVTHFVQIAIILVLLFKTNVNAQTVETVGAGVIDFLLTNPETADKMNDAQYVALDIISELLKTSAHRKQQLNIAKAGKSEIVLNSGSQSAILVKGVNGEVYLISDINFDHKVKMKTILS